MMQNKERVIKEEVRRIGVTGGVGSGKSEVLHYIQEKYGALVLRTDDLAKELMDPGEVCYEEVRALFGPEIVREDGTFDRAGIAAKVFSDPVLLGKLNEITHPAVLKRTEELICSAEKQGTRIVCIESALFVDANGNIKGATLTTAKINSGTISADLITAAGFKVRSSVLNYGTVGNGGTVPLPSGYTEAQCLWVVYQPKPPGKSGYYAGNLVFHMSGRKVTDCYALYASIQDSGPINVRENLSASYRIIGIK